MLQPSQSVRNDKLRAEHVARDPVGHPKRLVEQVCGAIEMMRYGIDYRALIGTALSLVGLLSPARTIENKLKAYGWLKASPLVPQEAFKRSCVEAVQALREKKHQFGDYLEFGVSRGTSYACAYHAFKGCGLPEMRLIGFDSFEGFPKEAIDQGWYPGSGASALSTTMRYLRKEGVPEERIKLVKGWYRDTLTPKVFVEQGLSKASILMLDCDLYTSTQEALAFSEPLIDDHAVMFFDDWGYRSEVGKIGQKEAFEEFLAAFPALSATPLPAYNRYARAFLVSRAPRS